MMTLDCFRPQELKFLKRHGERILIASFFGNNRPCKFVEFQQKVFSNFGFPVNHVLTDFSRYGHGSAIDCFLRKVGRAYDYFILFDTDAVPLKPDFIKVVYDKIRDKRTLFGIAQQSNHIFVNSSKNHLYVGPGALAISRELYFRLGRPTFSDTHRSDTAEELTWSAEKLGCTVALIFPSHVHHRLWDLGNGHFFGIGTTYGDCVFHAFCPLQDRSRRLFARKCKQILGKRRAGRGC